MSGLDINFLQSELNRVSERIRFADQKSAFIATFSVACVGFLINKIDGNNCIDNIVLSFIVLSFLMNFFFLLKSVFPKLENESTKKSLFYYGIVAQMKVIDYIKDFNGLTVNDIKQQLMEQIYTNSCIANIKMQNIQTSIIFLAISIILGVIYQLI